MMKEGYLNKYDEEAYLEQPYYAHFYDIPAACYVVGTIGVGLIMGLQMLGFLFIIVCKVVLP